MTREQASRFLYKLQCGLLTPSEKQLVLDEVLVALLTLYVDGVPPAAGPRVLLTRPERIDRLLP